MIDSHLSSLPVVAGANPRKVLFVVNRSKPNAEALVQELARAVEIEGSETVIHYEYPLARNILEGVGLCIVVGGDGTLLGVVEATSAESVPVLGVNLGRLGFMATFTPDDARQHLAQILRNGAPFRDLAMLACRRDDYGERLALNDIVIKTQSSRLIRLEVSCETEPMNTYHADGLIFATPTGSTAYNLSAGGPIVHPNTKAMVVTPINPHTLSTRPIVLDESHTLNVRQIGDPQIVQISADGQMLHEGHLARPIEICLKRDRCFRLLQPQGYSHYSILRTKLGWSGDAVFS